MELRPILSTLRRHKTTVLLVLLEIALTCAIVSNAVFLINRRLQRMHMPSGVAEHELVQVMAAGIGRHENPKARSKEDLALLRQIPGVQSVALVGGVPFGHSSWDDGLRLDPEQKENTLVATTYDGENLVPTFGLRLVAGRDFDDGDYRDYTDVIAGTTKWPGTAIITKPLADKLWPGESALGKAIYFRDEPVRVIGVVARLVRPNPADEAQAQWSVIRPLRMDGVGIAPFVLRTAPGSRDAVIKQAMARLKQADPRRIMRQRTLDELRANFFREDRAMAGLLIAVIAALLLVTALGIAGLTSFWVQQRTRQIGIRRALGATRADILRYFQTENFLIVGAGVVLGMTAAYGLNLWLMRHYEVGRLPWFYLPVGAVALWLLGQLAVLAPALRAAAVPPVVATRTV